MSPAQAVHVHLVARFSDRLFRVGNVVQRHQRVVEEYGAVWFGKFGQPVGGSTADLLRPPSVATWAYLFLVQTGNSGTRVFRGPILDVTFEPPCNELRLVPKDYGELNLTRLIW